VSGDQPHPVPARQITPALAPIVFALLTLAMFGDVLFSGSRVLSAPSTDMALQFLPWRHFGFSQLRAGNLALWNPHVYGGTPYLAGFQSALLYPPNWLHLVLPLNVAINWGIALHVFAAGYFTYLWCRVHDISVAGAILAGAMFMSGGPYFLHIYAGHLPHVAVMVWAPLILLAIDGVARSGSVRWAVLGTFAIAMQILAGHPQYVYYTAIVAGAYALLRLATGTHRLMLAGCFVAMYVAAALLTAVQLLPGIAATRESVRGAGTEYQFASTFALPPQNLVTLVAPNFFGRLPPSESAAPPDAYWGAGYLWEMSLFASAAGLVLAVYGVAVDRSRRKWIAVAMVLVTLVLALGRHTPLYRLMYDYLPGYSSFRGTVKFTYLAILFIAVLAGLGLDRLRESRRPPWAGIGLAGAACVVLLVAAYLIARSGSDPTDGAWAKSLRSFAKEYGDAREIFVRDRPEDYAKSAFVSASARGAARSLCVAAAVSGTCALMFLLSGTRIRLYAITGLVALAVAELFVFARASRATMVPAMSFPPEASATVSGVYQEWEHALREMPRDRRALLVLSQFSNLGMSMGFDSVWGYDPLVLRRYAKLMAASQGQDPDKASQYVAFRRARLGVLRMLRCGLVLVPDARQPVVQVPDVLPVAVLVGSWIELPTRDSIFTYVVRDEFDPRRGVVLERDPGIASGDAKVTGGTVEITGSGTDWLDLRVNTPRQALLLVTNNYARGWRALPRGDTTPPQPRYEIIPANYVQQAIPLQAGLHALRIEYSPVEFRVGVWASAVSWLAFVGAVVVMYRRRSRGGQSLRPAGDKSAHASP
jgi:hypothetical protein